MSARKILGIIQGVEIYLHADGHVSWLADADVDCDGRNPNYDHDPYYQNDTTLHNNGEALDAYTEPYIVVPPLIIKAVVPIVMGCQARLTYRETGIRTDCVVGDVGPRQKVGEASVCACKTVGIPHNPNTGGESSFFMCLYELWPGHPALVNGVQYHLQSYGG